MAERTRIARYFAPLAANEPGSFDLTDDAALLTPPAGEQIVVTTDSVIEGVHVMDSATPTQFAHKLVRRNLSDLAAMGARPWRYFLNIHTSDMARAEWVAEFAAALGEEQDTFGMVLAGGDTSSGGNRVHLTMTCLGLLSGAALLRSTAQVGDDVYVSGTIGDAALALLVLKQQIHPHDSSFLLQRYHQPTPRLALGQSLRNLASAAIDISDGLVADAHALARASNVQLALRREAIPLSDAARAVAPGILWPAVLDGGDDYELLFTAAVSARAAVEAMEVTRIGQVVVGSGVTLDGAPVAAGGYEHK